MFHGQWLFQQYLVDAWAACEQNKLDWVRHNQKKHRAEVYSGVVDAMLREDMSSADIGRRIILPSSYTGGDRYMQQLYQDSMAIVSHFGRPSLFITFTANPKWIEIQRELFEGQTALDRPDLVAWVLSLKVRQLLKLLKYEHIFGRYCGCVWTIEYQKRGLPHLHLLLFLDTESQLLDPDRID